jgi:hypothetical protein
MAMGQAAGVAAVISIREKTSLRKINPWKIQKELLGQNAMLIYFKDLKPGDPHYQSAQFFAVRRFLGREGWTARLAEPVSETDAEAWVRWSGLESPETTAQQNEPTTWEKPSTRQNLKTRTIRMMF